MMLFILNEKYLIPKYIPNSGFRDCNSLWINGKKCAGYLLHNITPFCVSNDTIPNTYDLFLKAIATELLYVLSNKPNKSYLTGYKYKLTKNKAYTIAKNWPSLELFIGEGIDPNSQLIGNTEYLKKINFNSHMLIQHVPGQEISVNWEILLYILKKYDFPASKIKSHLNNTLMRFNTYRLLTDKNASHNMICIIYKTLFHTDPNILFNLNTGYIRKKCIQRIKQLIITELEEMLQIG